MTPPPLLAPPRPDVCETLVLSLLHFCAMLGARGICAPRHYLLHAKRHPLDAIAILRLCCMVSARSRLYVVLGTIPASPVASSAQSPSGRWRALVNLASQNVSPRRTPLLLRHAASPLVELWFLSGPAVQPSHAGGFFWLRVLRRRDSKPHVADLLARCRNAEASRFNPRHPLFRIISP